MMYANLYTRKNPYGQLTTLAKWPEHVIKCVKTHGEYFGACPCCDKQIIIKAQGRVITNAEKELLT